MAALPSFPGKAELDGETGAAFAAYAAGSSRAPEAMFRQQASSTSRQHPRRHRRRGAPGLLACSRSSDEILQRSPNVALSPVRGPGATSFSSVASAFDFQHHIGSDPASELLVLKHILTRECLLSRLEAVCHQLRKRFQLLPTVTSTSESAPAVRLKEGSEGILELLSKMRGATVAVIEAISVWRKDMTGYPPSAFVWHGDNYLLKITNDLNFLAGVQPLVDTLKVPLFGEAYPLRACDGKERWFMLKKCVRAVLVRMEPRSHASFRNRNTNEKHETRCTCMYGARLHFTSACVCAFVNALFVVSDAPGAVLQEPFDAAANVG